MYSLVEVLVVLMVTKGMDLATRVHILDESFYISHWGGYEYNYSNSSYG